MIEDLHVHSTMSDGSDTFEQVLEQAAQRGVERLAFTNHDTTVGLTAARELGERLGVQMVGGIEVSAYDFERGRKVHILGLGVEEGAPALGRLVRVHAAAAQCELAVAAGPVGGSGLRGGRRARA